MQEKRHDRVVEMRLCFFSGKAGDYKMLFAAIRKCCSTLCTRAGMLESFLPNPELMTDDEVMIVLKIAFHQPAMKPVLEKLAAESEARKTLTE